MKIWIVCQKNESQIPVKVMAFASKETAAQDCTDRLIKAPASSTFWLEHVEWAGVMISDDDECNKGTEAARLNG